MIPVVETLLLTGASAGVLLCLLAVYTVRRYDELGVKAFGGFLTVLGVGAIGVNATLLLVSGGDGSWENLASLPYLVWSVSSVPWFLFTLQYTGRVMDIRWQTVVLLYTPLLGYALNIAISFLNIEGLLVVQSLIGAGTFLYALSLVLVGSALLLWTTYQYGHLSFFAAGLLVTGPIGVFLTANVQTVLAELTPLTVGFLTSGYLFLLLVSALGVVRYETFEVTPAVGTLGEREIVREIDDLVFVVDDDTHIIECNEAVAETLDRSRTGVLGSDLSTVLGHDRDELAARETVTLDTVDGKRRYDPQLSAITDQHDRELGVLVSLHDVTERELREQRLTVLNRVLRHNLRNKIEVVKGHAEVLDANGDSEHLRTILDTADSIGDLGDSARRIDQFVSGSPSSNCTEVDVAATIHEQLERLDTPSHDVTVSVDVPPVAPVETNREALAGALDSALDNALTYAETSVDVTVTERQDGYTVSIADDGPGIPEVELDSLDSGTETALQHGTGLGLWQLKWAVMTMGGDLDVETGDGTTVTFTVPCQ
jgi:signal transduction histidine kinase